MDNIMVWRVAMAVSSLLLFGCSHAPLGKDFNEANANNIAVQTVNPNAGKAVEEAATLDGQKADEALQRYRTNTGRTSDEKLLTNMK